MSTERTKRIAEAAQRASAALAELSDACSNAIQQPGERLPSHDQAAQVLGDPETAEGAL